MLQQNNPKKVGTKAWERFEKYKHATTIGEANEKGANWQDVSSDFEKGFLRLVDGHGEQDAVMSAPAKRGPLRKAHQIVKAKHVQKCNSQRWCRKFWKLTTP